jgi:hypothetical protein
MTALQIVVPFCNFKNRSGMMYEEKNTAAEEKKTEKKPLKEENFETKKDWAEAAYQELADYIEEQGIYIRY